MTALSVDCAIAVKMDPINAMNANKIAIINLELKYARLVMVKVGQLQRSDFTSENQKEAIRRCTNRATDGCDNTEDAVLFEWFVKLMNNSSNKIHNV